MNDKILVIPDVHGRNFWREAVTLYPDMDTIFLGDYHDPYPQEGISEEESLENFKELLDHVRIHPKCNLLLGNHDLHYLCNFGEGCRLDYRNSATIHGMLYDNFYLFAMAAFREINGKTVLFSHAPIMLDWLKAVNETDRVPLLVGRLNRLLSTIFMKPWEVENMLGQISEYRGGYDDVGSPVWADVRELMEHPLISTPDYSIFAHTLMDDAVITDRWANLDCRKAFLLDSELNLKPLPT